MNLRWSSCGATKPPKNASPLNSRQRRSKRRLEEFLSRKEMKLRKELSPLDNLSACKDAMIVDQRRQEDDGCKDAKRAKFTVVNNEGGGPEGALTRKTHSRSPATLAQTARTDITSTRVKVQESRTQRPSCPQSDQRRRSTFKYRAGQRLVTRVSDIKTTVLILDRYPNNRDHDQLQLHADNHVQQHDHFDSAVDCPVYVVRTHRNDTLLVPENQLTYR